MDDRLTRQVIMNFEIVSGPFRTAFECILTFYYLFLFVLGLVNWRKLYETRTKIREEIIDAMYAVQDENTLEVDIQMLEMKEFVPSATYQGMQFGKWLNYQLHPRENIPEDD